MSAQAYGVKDLKEAILAMVVLGKFMALRLKDGVDIGDAIALGQALNDEKFKAVLMAGVDGLEKVPEEIRDLSLAEVFELAEVLPMILAELKK